MEKAVKKDRVEQRVCRVPEPRGGSKISGASVLERIMTLVHADGSVVMPGGETQAPEPVDFSRLSLGDQEEVQLDLAGTLYRHVERVRQATAGDRLQGKLNEQSEPHIALECARFRQVPGFLESVAHIVDEVLQERQERATRTRYPTIY